MDGVDDSIVTSSSSNSHSGRSKNANAAGENDFGEYNCCGNLIGLSETILCYESNDLIVSNQS